MATMKYIGARYMPKFMGTYDATTAYEALSVVDNGSGTTYVANKPVPAGTALTDTEYWTVYGASSGAILDLQNRMGTAENAITSLQGRMTSAEGNITTAQADINRLDSFSNLKNKTIAIFGASNELAAYTQNDNWVDRLASMLSGYSTIVNKSVSGTNLIAAIAAYNADPDKFTYDIVIFCCTKNLYNSQTLADVYSYVNMATCGIDTAIASLNANKSIDQQFYFASCTPYYDSFKGIPMCIYDGVVQRSAKKHGYSTLDMHSWLGVSDADSYGLTSDGIHFKAEVAPILAHRALTALAAGGEPFSNYKCELTNDDVITYLRTYANLLSNITRDNSVPSVLYCDVNLTVKMIAYLVNETGNAIAADTAIINTTGQACVLKNPNCVANKFRSTSLTPPYNAIEYSARGFQLIIETNIPNNNKFCVTWGYINSAMGF